jgi:muramoyltetrapeptide carboxypeptidase
MSAPGTEPPRAWRIGIYAPAGFATEPSAVERAVERLRAAGHRVTVDPTCGTRWQRFSAPDDERLAAVMRMAEDPDVELAIPVRGGYGWSRLLDRLDYAAIARSGTRWIGHSDFTAFQLAALAHAGLATYAGPMAAYDFGAATPSTFTHEHCWRLLGSGRDAVACTLGGPDVVAEGTLWGGNLALVAHLAGTAHLPQVDNGILFLEDIGEHPYRIERMLHQLRFAGILERQQAIVLGRFNGYEPTANDDGYDFAAMVEQLRAHCAVPILTGLPFGHCRDKLTLPVGGRCALTVRGGAAELVLTGSAAPMAAPGAAPGAASAVASAAGGAATGAPAFRGAHRRLAGRRAGAARAAPPGVRRRAERARGAGMGRAGRGVPPRAGRRRRRASDRLRPAAARRPHRPHGGPARMARPRRWHGTPRRAGPAGARGRAPPRRAQRADASAGLLRALRLHGLRRRIRGSRDCAPRDGVRPALMPVRLRSVAVRHRRIGIPQPESRNRNRATGIAQPESRNRNRATGIS